MLIVDCYAMLFFLYNANIIYSYTLLFLPFSLNSFGSFKNILNLKKNKGNILKCYGTC